MKKLKSPNAAPGPPLPQAQAETALSLLSDWFFECSGAVPLSTVDHPKLRSFLHHVGLPPLPRRELAGVRLDTRYAAARADADARVRDAGFFQLATSGWRNLEGGDSIVSIGMNLPNGSSVFRRAVFNRAPAPSDYAEQILSDALAELPAHRCAGIVADRFKSKALRNIETQNHWMVSLACQLTTFRSLATHLAAELPLFGSANTNCSKLTRLFNTNPQARSVFHKYQLQELGYSGLLRVNCFSDILNSSRPLQLAINDESYKLLCLEDSNARELAEIISNLAFWTELEAAHSLVKLINDMAREMEAERPLVAQCLPLWEELRSKVKEWCRKFSIDEVHVMKVLDKRFKKNYHPAWSAAFILDPLYLIRDASGKYLPPFKCLTPEQEKDVDKLIMRLVSREEAHIVLMELMKWRSDGLESVYAQAVQVKQLDPKTGKLRVANPQGSRIVWETYLSEFKSLGRVATRLIFLHATACGFKCNMSMRRWVSANGRSKAGMDRAQKMIFVAANARLERRQFLNEEENDAELFGDEADDVLNEAFVDASSV